MKYSVGRLLSWGLLAVPLLSGCAAGYLLDNNVQAFSVLPVLREPPTYRFERLPSQQSPAQAQLEAVADPALQRAGLRRDDANPHYTVQVGARLQRVLSPWATGWDGWGWDGWGWGGAGWGWGGGWGAGVGFGYPFGRMESPWYQREVSVIVRELPANRAVFESHAANEGPWLDNNSVFPAMFEAALQGFPNPPVGPRRVDIRIGR